MPLKLYKRGTIWHYRGTVAGRLIRGSTKTSVKSIAERIRADQESRHWKGHLDGPSSVLTFAQAAMLYRSAGKSDRFLRKIEDHWKDTPVKAMPPGAIRQSAIVLYPTAGPATRNRQAIVPTQAVINHAAEQELCPRIRVKRFPVVKRAKQPVTWEWVRAFMAAANETGNAGLAALACFMYLTGARISQSLAVRWADVDFKQGTVRIGSAKGGDERFAHMPPELIAALANMPGERAGRIFVFKSRGNARTQWAGACRRAGIQFLSYHRCRHGFATGLLHRGVNPITAAKRGGWKDVRQMLENYGHDIAEQDVTGILTDTNPAHPIRKLNAIK
jgi:integrase